MAQPPISSRKADHIDLCVSGDVGFRRKSNLIEEIELIHDALPELAVDEIDLSTEFAGKTLQAPVVIAAMTGGVDRAERINRDLAQVAQKLGIGFAFGSQRPLLSKGITLGYKVRDVAPDALVIGNIGVVQAAESSTGALAELVEMSGADALAIHLNPAMEVVQPEGDQDFRRGLETIGRLVEELPVPVVVKETGCGLSRAVGQRLVGLGVKYVDTSGAGGTSWVAVETHRAKDQKRMVGDTFWDWGIPTAGSVAQLADLPLESCATGGMSDGLMIARAIALGARCGGIARAFLQAHAAGGLDGAMDAAKRVIQEIRVACLLTGSRDLAALRQTPLLIGPGLMRWIPRGSPIHERIGF
ncbi:MAG: type 2 isopentenyl-diphosphate Delta-isomerase [Myxococcota bacterium]